MISLQLYKLWRAETILSGWSHAYAWWYAEQAPKHLRGVALRKAIKTTEAMVTLTLIKCKITPMEQTIVLGMDQKQLQAGMVMPQRMALVRLENWPEGSVWVGEPVWLPKAKEKRVDIFFTLQGEYDD
jgi:hypothetical protein